MICCSYFWDTPNNLSLADTPWQSSFMTDTLASNLLICLQMRSELKGLFLFY